MGKHDTSFKLDPKIEAFAEYRDNLHRNFKWSGKTFFRVGLWAIAVPLFFYVKLKQSVMDQFEAEGRQVRLVNMFNLVREHPLDKKPIDYQAVFKDAEKPNADEGTQKDTGVYLTPYTREPTGAQRPNRTMQ